MSVLSGSGGLPDNEGKSPSQVITDGTDTRLGSMFSGKMAEHLDQNGVVLLRERRDAFDYQYDGPFAYVMSGGGVR